MRTWVSTLKAAWATRGGVLSRSKGKSGAAGEGGGGEGVGAKWLQQAVAEEVRKARRDTTTSINKWSNIAVIILVMNDDSTVAFSRYLIMALGLY